MTDVTNRVGTIGGSDVAAILGVSPWSTPTMVYEQTLGIAPPAAESEAMRVGQAVERPLLDLHEARFADMSMLRGLRVEDEHYPYMAGNLDGYYVDETSGAGTIVEAKSTTLEWGDDVPEYYRAQVGFYMGITGAASAHVVVCELTWEIRSLIDTLWAQDKVATIDDIVETLPRHFFVVPRDEDYIHHIRERVVAFWDSHIIPQVPPDPMSLDEVVSRWPLDPDDTIVADSEMLGLLHGFAAVRQEKARSTEAEKAIRLELRRRSRTASRIVDAEGNVLCRVHSVERKGYTVEPGTYERIDLGSTLK